MKVRTRLSYLLASCILAGVVAGCTRAQARVAPEPPGLDVPLPPPRSVETYATEVPQTVETPVGQPSIGIDDGIRATAARGTSGTTPKVGTAKPTDSPKPDGSVVADAPKASDESRTQPAASPLQTTPRPGEVEAAIKSDMERASGILTKIDYQRLNADARTQYGTAQSYIVQAEEALRSKNLPLAKTLTEKAAVIAAQLSGR